MAKAKVEHTLTVSGKGAFPDAMLRYDGLVYGNGEQQGIAESYTRALRDDNRARMAQLRGISRTVILSRVDDKRYRATKGRWLSFGWAIVSHRIELAEGTLIVRQTDYPEHGIRP